jgi:methionyl-tRNA formyltransferase
MDKSFAFYLMGEKGFNCLNTIIQHQYKPKFVVCSKDTNLQKDFFEEIKNLCNTNKIPFYDRKKYQVNYDFDYLFVISWRWLIKENLDKIIIFHDSILPKLRGFNPLVTALIEGDTEIGVTALKAEKMFDTGDILGQKFIKIIYPIKIQHAIELVSNLYQDLLLEIINKIKLNQLSQLKQNESIATYSVWRDELDYLINWGWDASKIKRFVDAVASPYDFAKIKIDENLYRVHDVEVIEDKKIINRDFGKILYFEDGCPIVICYSGLLKLVHVEDKNGEKLKFTNLRLRLDN